MTSSDDICKVLYRELRLPQNGSKPSSAKDVLQKLTHLHQLPQIILEWRKLNASVTKVVFPMSRAAQLHKGKKKTASMCFVEGVRGNFVLTKKVTISKKSTIFVLSS